MCVGCLTYCGQSMDLCHRCWCRCWRCLLALVALVALVGGGLTSSVRARHHQRTRWWLLVGAGGCWWELMGVNLEGSSPWGCRRLPPCTMMGVGLMMVVVIVWGWLSGVEQTS